MKYISIFLSICLCLSLFIIPLSGCNNQNTRTFFAADTVCQITLYDGGTAVLDQAVELCKELADMLDSHSADSLLSVLNSNGYGEQLDSRFIDVLQKGLYYSSLKDGIFDITIKPVSELWDFKNSIIPTEVDINKALSKVDYKRINISGNSVELNGAEIDLGAIAKGYITDRIINFLSRNGVKSAIVNLGGNVSVLGKNKSRDFSIGITKPFEQTICAAVELSDRSVVTSGIYQRYIEKDGVIYHHLLDTATGKPKQNGLYSVTVIAPEAIDADALSTLCFLLGKEEGMKLIEQTSNTEAVFIDDKNEIYLTSGLSIDASNKITIN